jgi:hypothetical protein
MISAYLSVVALFIKAISLFMNIDPAYLDLVKIFAGSIGWIGGLTMFMWIRERRREAERALVKQISV